MKIQTHIDAETRIRRHKVSGRLVTSELMAALEEVYAGSTGTDYSSLWDLTEAEVDLTADDVRALSALVSRNWGTTSRVRSAIVVSEELAFGLGRMYEALVSSRTASPILICRTVEEATRWLEPSRGV